MQEWPMYTKMERERKKEGKRNFAFLLKCVSHMKFADSLFEVQLFSIRSHFLAIWCQYTLKLKSVSTFTMYTKFAHVAKNELSECANAIKQNQRLAMALIRKVIDHCSEISFSMESS